MTTIDELKELIIDQINKSEITTRNEIIDILVRSNAKRLDIYNMVDEIEADPGITILNYRLPSEKSGRNIYFPQGTILGTNKLMFCDIKNRLLKVDMTKFIIILKNMLVIRDKLVVEDMLFWFSDTPRWVIRDILLELVEGDILIKEDNTFEYKFLGTDQLKNLDCYSLPSKIAEIAKKVVED